MRGRGEVSRGDQGFGLAELMVSMALFSIAVAAVAAVLIGTLDTVRFTTTKNRVTADARIGMDAVSRSLRVAVQPPGEDAAIVSATASGVSFYSSLDRGGAQTPDRPTKVTYAHGALGGRTCLLETQVPASDNTGADSATKPFVWTSTGVTTCLVETATAPAFAYYDTGRLTDPTTGADTSPLPVPSSGLELVDRQRVVSVQVDLAGEAAGAGDVPPVFARDRVTLSNLIEDLDSGGTA
jgi:prepilin-type N-terminal cleavage/methylation domain-containing protein